MELHFTRTNGTADEIIDSLMEIKANFSDILVSNGDLFMSGPLTEEMDEPEIVHLPRIILDFNRRDFGRLRELIDVINSV